MLYTEVVRSYANGTFKEFVGQFRRFSPNLLLCFAPGGFSIQGNASSSEVPTQMQLATFMGVHCKQHSAKGPSRAVKVLLRFGADVNLAGGYR